MDALCTYFLKLCGFDFESAIKRVSIYPVIPYVDKMVNKKVKVLQDKKNNINCWIGKQITM